MFFNFKSSATLLALLATPILADPSAKLNLISTIIQPQDKIIQEGDLILTETLILDNNAIVTFWVASSPKNTTTISEKFPKKL
ncbi:hypothetical protein QBC38DRAFT_495605 [Podospora fimiseda]|uniref:Uncharacterized protein n=1 Tax=Podospora fimiseda TaxID=252190 RepID=A0AAN7H3Z5_9PEZI|nr:hypothetical protein QBC38DRAFT_495605 [Podospora fimiseda]